LIAACILVAAGAITAGGIALAHRHGTPTSPARLSGTTPHSHGGRANAAGRSPTPAPAAPAPSPSPSPTQQLASDSVAVSGAAASSPQRAGVVSFLEAYFTAINSHDYHGYRRLLGPQARAAFTRSQFTQGFRSTSDSMEKVKRIFTAGGDTVAVVNFTSHQDPADSVNGQESCTRWHISLYLQPTVTGYTIGPAPPGYHASYASCS